MLSLYVYTTISMHVPITLPRVPTRLFQPKHYYLSVHKEQTYGSKYKENFVHTKAVVNLEKIFCNGKLLGLHRQLVVSIPRLSVPFCHLLGKINAMGTFFSTRHLYL